MRDLIAHKVCNFVITRIATHEYRAMITLVMIYGLAELDKRLEEELGRDARP